MAVFTSPVAPRHRRGEGRTANVGELTGPCEAPIGGGLDQAIRELRSSFIMTVSVSSAEATEGQISSGFWALTLGSIGVVFGDIGTSPLYAFRAAVSDAAHGQPPTRLMVLGVLSLILWALLIVVT